MEDWEFTDEAILDRTKNCSVYFHHIPALFEIRNVIEIEKNILRNVNGSIGYNIMVHLQPGIFEFFLALYFRPYDHYVIHLDAKVM